MTQTETLHAAVSHHALIERDEPLIFDRQTPRHVIVATIAKYSRHLASLPGQGYLTELPEKREMYGATVYVVRLFADALRWEAYLASFHELFDDPCESVLVERDPDSLIDPVALFASARA